MFYNIEEEIDTKIGILEEELKKDFLFTSLMISTISRSKKLNNILEGFGLYKHFANLADGKALEITINKSVWNLKVAVGNLENIVNTLLQNKINQRVEVLPPLKKKRKRGSTNIFPTMVIEGEEEDEEEEEETKSNRCTCVCENHLSSFDISPLHDTLDEMWREWSTIYGKDFLVGENVVDIDLQPTQRLDEFMNLVEGNNLHEMLVELLMSDKCRRNFREATNDPKRMLSNEEVTKKREKLALFQKQRKRKSKIARFIMEIICNERWNGKGPLTPMIESLSYLASCGSTSNSFGAILSKLRITKSLKVGTDMKRKVTNLTAGQFKSEMELSIHPTIPPNLFYWTIVGYDNYQKNKTVDISNQVGGKSTFIQLIVGYYMRSTPTSIDPLKFRGINFCFNKQDLDMCLERSFNETFIDTNFFNFFSDLPQADSSISILHTSNFPPIRANSGSEKSINDQIIDSLLTDQMMASQRPILTVSDPEPSHLHQKITNKRLERDESDAIRNIVNVPGRMHIEMHIWTSICTYQPHLFILCHFLVAMFGYKPDLFETSLSKELGKMIDDLNVYIIKNDLEIAEWTPEFIQEVRDCKVLDPSSLPKLLPFFRLWTMIPVDKRKLTGKRRTYMNLPQFSQLRHHLRAMSEGWLQLDEETKKIENQINEFFKELEFFLIPITNAQCGRSAEFFSRFGAMIALFKVSNRPRLVQVTNFLFDCEM